MATQQGVKIPIGLDTKDGEKEMGHFKRFMSKQSEAILEIMGGKGFKGQMFNIFGAGIGGAAMGTANRLLSDPLTSYNAAKGDAAAEAAHSGISGAGMAIGTAMGGMAGGQLGEKFGDLIGKAIGSAIQGGMAKTKFVSGGSTEDVQSVVAQFAQAGVPVGDQDIIRLLNQFKDQRDRMFDAMERVATLEGGRMNDLAGKVRNSTMNVVRRGTGWMGL